MNPKVSAISQVYFMAWKRPSSGRGKVCGTVEPTQVRKGAKTQRGEAATKVIGDW
jgi:hypothetical protein